MILIGKTGWGNLLDARAIRDRVGVATEDQDIVMVTTLSLGDDVEGDALLNGGINLEVSGDLTRLQGSEDGLGILLADADNGSVVLASTTQGTGERAGLVVVDDGTNSTGSLGADGLSTKGALTTADEGNVAGELSGVVRGLAAQVADDDERGRDIAAGGVGHGPGRDLGTVNSEGAISGGVGLGEGLLGDVVVVKATERVDEEVDGGVVASAAKGAGAVVGISNVLEPLGPGKEAVDVDGLLELLGRDKLLAARREAMVLVMPLAVVLAVVLAMVLAMVLATRNGQGGQRQSGDESSGSLHLGGLMRGIDEGRGGEEENRSCLTPLVWDPTIFVLVLCAGRGDGRGEPW